MYTTSKGTHQRDTKVGNQNERTLHIMGLALPTGDMKRGSTVKSLHTKSKVTKAKR
jgi:hypothetical protein